MAVNFWICAWLIFCENRHPPNLTFLARDLIKNLHTATFASMLMKSSGLLQEAARGPFSIWKRILSIFWSWKRLFSKHIEAEQEIHHAYKKECIYNTVLVHTTFKNCYTWTLIDPNSNILLYFPYRRKTMLILPNIALIACLVSGNCTKVL